MPLQNGRLSPKTGGLTGLRNTNIGLKYIELDRSRDNNYTDMYMTIIKVDLTV